MGSLRSFALSLALAVVACDRPHPLVICHNSNCTGDTRSSNSDTIEGLRAALALTYDGGRLLDGIELDLLWDTPRDRCAFAHDPETAPTRADVSVAVDELRTWANTQVDPMIVILDAKPADDPAAFVNCVVSAADSLTNSTVLDVYISSGDPALLRAIDAAQVRRGLSLRLTAGFASPAPLSSGVPLSGFVDIPLFGVAYHPRWITDQQVSAFHDAGLELFFWSHVLTVETLDSIDRYQPFAVGTDDVELLRGWVDG